jgi:hypothetical protein
MGHRLLDHVRAGCKTVAERATHIQINYDLIPAYADSLPLESTIQPAHDSESHYLGQNEDTAAFFLTLDSINFGSGYFPHLSKRPGMSGYFTVASCLNDRFKEKGPLSALELTRLTPEDCTQIFEQDPDNTPAGELMRLFAKALNDLGWYVQQDFNSSFTALIEAAGGSAERLMQLLVRMPYFYDVQLYDRIEVGQGLGRFDDLQNLTIFADNLVPHVLRMDNILLYTDALVSQIEAGRLISPGAPEEIEIRACALHAVELLKKALNASGHKITSMGLDFLLWNRGQQPAYKAVPRHRCRTVFY